MNEEHHALLDNFSWDFVSMNANNTHFNTLSNMLFLLVKIHMGPTKSCGFHINLVGPM